MKVLFVASECAPFVKTGGLADVVSALPKALKETGASVRVMIPAYPALASLVASGRELLREDDVFLGDLRVTAASAEGLELLLVTAPHLYNRPGNPYLDPDGRDWPDNHLRFAALGRMAAIVARKGIGRGKSRWRPDVLHAHDWQAGLGPTFLRLGPPAAARTVTTIHNIAFQGLFGPEQLALLNLAPTEFHIEGLEYFGNISFLKAGLVWADRITTVSPTYARELLSPEFGMGFEGILGARAGDFTGILNGVDLDVWNPVTDPALAANFGPNDLSARSANRRELLDRFDLDLGSNAPLFCVVSRLTRQKGLDMLLEVLPRLLARGAGLVLLGSGDGDLEAGFKAAAADSPTRIGVRIGYDESLSHLMQGGADCIVIPSRFEPCGLTQLYGLRYGCLPLVARVGGLADTVIDLNEAARAAGVATGFQFSPTTSADLASAIDRCCDAFLDRELWEGMMRRAMRHPVGWESSAEAYLALYSELTAVPESRKCI